MLSFILKTPHTLFRCECVGGKEEDNNSSFWLYQSIHLIYYQFGGLRLSGPKYARVCKWIFVLLSLFWFELPRAIHTLYFIIRNVTIQSLHTRKSQAYALFDRQIVHKWRLYSLWKSIKRMPFSSQTHRTTTNYTIKNNWFKWCHCHWFLWLIFHPCRLVSHSVLGVRQIQSNTHRIFEYKNQIIWQNKYISVKLNESGGQTRWFN